MKNNILGYVIVAVAIIIGAIIMKPIDYRVVDGGAKCYSQGGQWSDTTWKCYQDGKELK